MKKYIITIGIFMLVVCSLILTTSAASVAGDRLPSGSIEKAIYNELKPQIADVANGKSTSTAFTVTSGLSSLKWTAAELGCTLIENGAVSTTAKQAISEKFKQKVDLLKVLYSLQQDCPYELYWFNPTEGIATGYNLSVSEDTAIITDLTVYFSVYPDFAGSAENTVDTAKTKAAAAAVANADAIITANASKTDRQKLEAYCNQICSLVSYDHITAGSSVVTVGNPYQIPYVFDGISSTNVICEGYSRAFQYLCDRTTFSGNVVCYTVSGTVAADGSTYGHTWNIVSIGGTNYLVDITNCDMDKGSPDTSLFLVRTENSLDDSKTHTFPRGSSKITYTYNVNMQNLVCNGYPSLSTPKGNTPGTSSDAVIADVTIPVGGKTPDYTVTIADTSKHSVALISWYDVANKKLLSETDVFIEGYLYEVRVEFAAVGNTVLDGDTEYYINGSATYSYGTSTQRGIIFTAVAPTRIPHKITVTGGTATLDGKEVSQAVLGDRITLTAAATEGNKTFFKWIVVAGNVTLSNAYTAEAVFSMPEADVVIEVDYISLHHLTSVEGKAADCSGGYKQYWSCSHCNKYFADDQALLEIGDTAALEAWKSAGGGGYIAPTDHEFDKHVASDKYLAEPATCTSLALYYRSCQCGESSMDSGTCFEAGEMAAHSFTVLGSDDSAHWNKCENCSAIDEASKKAHSGGEASCTAQAKCEICGASYGEKAAHDFIEVENIRYRVAENEYAKSCSVCGVLSDETFTSKPSGGCKTLISPTVFALVIAVAPIAIATRRKKHSK
ncbi:MAG: hypothetical protein IJY27_00045 [Clostridia bacterium]|nr:hypothetical protein [Clostridia bacterium]